MIARLRRRLARKLWPEAFDQADRHWYLMLLLKELRLHCDGELPDVRDAVDWALASLESRFREVGDRNHEAAIGFCRRLQGRHPASVRSGT